MSEGRTARRAPGIWTWVILSSVVICHSSFAGDAVISLEEAERFALAVSLWRVPVQSLRWDGKVWHLDTAAGELKVAVDLGPWMLLLFTPQAPGRASWLPVQRRGLEAQWHALRCAIYSPRAADQP